jgi:hypothetical protein
MTSSEIRGVVEIVLLSGFAWWTAFNWRILIRAAKALGELGHRWTSYRWKRITPAPELVPYLQEFTGRKDFDFAYKLVRTDNELGGLLDSPSWSRKFIKKPFASVWELERYIFALRASLEKYGTVPWAQGEEAERYREALPIFEAALARANAAVAQRKAHDRIFSEMDVASKQVWFAALSAVSSLAAAIAAIFSAVAAFNQHPPTTTPAPSPVAAVKAPAP